MDTINTFQKWSLSWGAPTCILYLTVLHNYVFRLNSKWEKICISFCFHILFSVLHTAINTVSPVLSPKWTSLNKCIEQCMLKFNIGKHLLPWTETFITVVSALTATAQKKAKNNQRDATEKWHFALMWLKSISKGCNMAYERKQGLWYNFTVNILIITHLC